MTSRRAGIPGSNPRGPIPHPHASISCSPTPPKTRPPRGFAGPPQTPSTTPRPAEDPAPAGVRRLHSNPLRRPPPQPGLPEPDPRRHGEAGQRTADGHQAQGRRGQRDPADPKADHHRQRRREARPPDLRREGRHRDPHTTVVLHPAGGRTQRRENPRGGGPHPPPNTPPSPGKEPGFP